jgi:hypothetical protein
MGSSRRITAAIPSNIVYPLAGEEQPVNEGFLHPAGPGAFHVRVVGGKDGRAVRVNGGHSPRKGPVLLLPVMQSQFNLGRPEGVKCGFQRIHVFAPEKDSLNLFSHDIVYRKVFQGMYS